MFVSVCNFRFQLHFPGIGGSVWIITRPRPNGNDMENVENAAGGLTIPLMKMRLRNIAKLLIF